MSSNNDVHRQLGDGMSGDLEVYRQIDSFFKIRIRDRSFPLNLIFYYDCSPKNKDLYVCYSAEHPQPQEGMLNVNSVYNVSQKHCLTLPAALKDPDLGLNFCAAQRRHRVAVSESHDYI